MMRSKLFAAGLTLALWLTAALTSAQLRPPPRAAGELAAAGSLPPLSEALQGEAKEDYVAARILFNDEDFTGALVKFQRAYERAGDPRLLWNMAACEKNLRHYASVLRLLERYEREGGSYMSPGHRAEFTDVLKTVRLLVSRVQIQVDPDGAQVFLDDVLVGTTPLEEPILVDLGLRKIRIHKAGYKDHLITRNFPDAAEVVFRLSLLLELHQGALAVTARSGDSIRVDNVVMGVGSWQGVLPSGEHTVRVTASGMRPYERQVFIVDDRTRNLYVTLESEPGSGVSPLLWVGIGLVAASGIAVASYLALRPESSGSPSFTAGTWGTIDLP